MPFRVRTVRDPGEYLAALASIGHYFGWSPTEQDAERFRPLLPLDRVHGVFDAGRIVAAAAAYPFELTVPGGRAPCAGISWVAVAPTHRRRGLLRRLMERQLDDVRERGEPLAALWASEETIYGRFGYGLVSTVLNVEAERNAVRIRPELPREAGARIVDHDEALAAFPRLYERATRARAGTIVRSRAWWESRRLDDDPERRRGGGPLVRVLFERDGAPVGYALYRISQQGSTPADWRKTVRVVEALGVDDRATRDVWRFLLEIDWVDRIEGFGLPLDHPLLLLVDRVNKLNATAWDGLWLRIVDVGAALERRRIAPGARVTIEVTSDPHFADNVGMWTLDGGGVRRGRRRPDVRLPVAALGSAYLGGLSFTALARAGLAEEGVRGGLERADAAFRTALAPWCPESF